jgi:CPA1 family monovalent cation:H+ antiporter
VVLAPLTLGVTARIHDVATAVIVQFSSTFFVWILAERLGLSGILTMVVYAMSVARTAPDLMPARLRIPSYAVWEVAVFVLNALAFILVGLQLKPILAQLGRAELLEYAGVAGAICATVILTRVVWVLGTHALRGPHTPQGRRGAMVVAWCGMRGTVTLAAALALPADFPYRDLVLFTSFLVVLGTLVIQGLTLKPLLRALDLHDDDPVGRELRAARERALQAALASIGDDQSPTAASVGKAFKVQLAASEADSAVSSALTRHGELQRQALQAARQAVIAMRANNEIGDDAFHMIEEQLDWLEMAGGRRPE